MWSESVDQYPTRPQCPRTSRSKNDKHAGNERASLRSFERGSVPPRFRDTCCLNHLFGAHAHIPLLPLLPLSLPPSLHAIFSPFSSNDLPATIDRSVGRATEPGREGGRLRSSRGPRQRPSRLSAWEWRPSVFCIAHRLDGCTPRFCGCNRIRSPGTFF